MNSIKKKIIVLSVVGLLSAGLVFGADIYTRNPSGFSISNPVSLRFQGALDNPEVHSWKFKVNNMIMVDYFSDCFTTNDETWTNDFPLSQYSWVRIMTWTDDVCSVGENDWTLEYDEMSPIFEVVPPPPYNYVPIDPNLPMDMLAFAGEMFNDLGSLITLAVGVPMAFVVIKKVISLIRT